MSGNLALAWEVFEIVWINILLSGDNAILIALACRRLPEERRRWGVLLGSLGGVALRIGFTLAIVQLLHVPLLKTAGALCYCCSSRSNCRMATTTERMWRPSPIFGAR